MLTKLLLRFIGLTSITSWGLLSWRGIAACTLALLSASTVVAQEIGAAAPTYSAQQRASASLPNPRYLSDARDPALVQLGELSGAEQDQLMTPDALGRDRVGLWRDVPEISAGVSSQRDTAPFAVVTYYQLTSTGAASLRLAIEPSALPTGTSVLFLSKSDAAVGHITIQEARQSGTIWSPRLPGDTVVVEVRWPEGAQPLPLNTWLPTVSHRMIREDVVAESAGMTTVERFERRSVGASGSCQIDVVCNTDWQATADGVARMVYEDGGSSFSCTGTLLNSAAGDFTPYCLSANHCFSTQAAASSVITDWFFEASACGSGAQSSRTVQLGGGAVLLTADLETDTLLLRLNNTPPTGARYIGWTTTTPAVNTPMTGVHHPSADLKKISQGQLVQYTQCQDLANPNGYFCNSGTVSDANAMFLDVQFSSGSTETGSSGSGIFVNNGQQLVGVQLGGSDSCSNPTGTSQYGRFDRAYTRNNWAQYLNTASSGASAFIERFYVQILGRASDAAGKAGWVDLMARQSAAAVALGFFNSAEFSALGLSNEAFVAILYTTLFDREADTAGRDFWVAALEGGTLREMVIYGFLRSQEFSNLAASFGATSFSQADQTLYDLKVFVQRFYQLVLLREPDAAGFDGWVNSLSQQVNTGGDIARGLFLSSEYLAQNTSDTKFVETCYQAFFDRAADSAGLQGWLDLLAQGIDRATVLNGFIGSQEFINLAARFGIRAGN